MDRLVLENASCIKALQGLIVDALALMAPAVSLLKRANCLLCSKIITMPAGKPASGHLSQLWVPELSVAEDHNLQLVAVGRLRLSWDQE